MFRNVPNDTTLESFVGCLEIAWPYTNEHLRTSKTLDQKTDCFFFFLKYILLKSQVNNSVYSFLFHTCENYPALPLGLRIHLLPLSSLREQREWTLFRQRTGGSELRWFTDTIKRVSYLEKTTSACSAVLGPHWTAWCYWGRQDDILAAFPENCRPTVWAVWRCPSCSLWAVYLKHTHTVLRGQLTW